MQIRPNAPLPIVYVISDPSDAGVYYVRSVLRNSTTGAIIKVNGLNYVNLTVDPTNSRRFSMQIQAPQDSSGNGFYIDVTTTVYTDSNYTVLSTGYQEENIKYLVLEPWSIALGSGGGRGGWTEEKITAAAIDYEKIKKLVNDILVEVLSKSTLNELKNTDISPILSKIEDVISAHKNLHKNLATLPESILDLKKTVKARPQFKETNINPIIEGIQNSIGTMDDIKKELIQHHNSSHFRLHEALERTAENSADVLKKAVQNMEGLKFTYHVESKPAIDSTAINMDRKRDNITERVKKIL